MYKNSLKLCSSPLVKIIILLSVYSVSSINTLELNIPWNCNWRRADWVSQRPFACMNDPDSKQIYPPVGGECSHHCAIPALCFTLYALHFTLYALCSTLNALCTTVINASAAVTLLEQRPEKIFRLWTGFEPTASAMPVQCSPNWAIKATWERSYMG